MPGKMTLGQIARFLREESGLTIAHVARGAGVSTATIVYFEKDTRELSDATTRKLFQFLLKAQEARRKRIEHFCGAMKEAMAAGKIAGVAEGQITGTSVSAEAIEEALVGTAA